MVKGRDNPRVMGSVWGSDVTGTDVDGGDDSRPSIKPEGSWMDGLVDDGTG